MGRVLPRTRLPRTPLWPQIHRIIPVAWLGIIWTAGCCYVGRASKKSQVVTTQKTNFLYCFFRCSKPRSAEHHPEWPSCRNLRDFAATTWREISRIWLLRTTRSAPCTGQKWIVPSLLQAEPDHFPVFFAFLQKQFKMYPLVIYYIHIENCPFIVDLAIRNGDFPWQTVSLPEGNQTLPRWMPSHLLLQASLDRTQRPQVGRCLAVQAHHFTHGGAKARNEVQSVLYIYIYIYTHINAYEYINI